MLKTETRTIDGLEVTTTQLPSMRALRLMTRIGRLIMPSLAKLDGLSVGALLRAEMSSIGPAVSELFDRLTDSQAEELVREILVATAVDVDGKRVELINGAAIDKVYSGNLPALFSTIRFALEVNYGGFFSVDSAPSPTAESTTGAPASP